MKYYLVGGAVRDTLLNLPTSDKDWVVVGAKPQDLIAKGFIQVGKSFPVFLHPLTKEEFALARTERKSGHGYNGFICEFEPHITLEQDLARRDLTINAIALDDKHRLIDPFNGADDIRQRVLRHVSPAFKDDPLRVLRVARFAARFHHLGFTIAAETIELMQSIVNAGEIAYLTTERVWKETEKALSTDDPQVYFEVLRQCGALKILFPEIDVLFGIPAPEKWHPEIDTGIHTLLVLKQAAQLTHSLPTRFAALCHDLGKGLTPPEKWPSHHGHGPAGKVLVKELCHRIKAPNSYLKLALFVCEYHDLVHKIKELRCRTIIDLLTSIGAWRDEHHLTELLICSEADYKGRYGWENTLYSQADYLKSAYQIASSVPVKEIITAGFSGGDIQTELRRRRILALKNWQKSLPDSTQDS